MPILKSVRKSEGKILGIAAIGILGGLGIYALIKSGPAIGNLFSTGINSLINGITGGINSAVSAATSPGGVAQPQAPINPQGTLNPPAQNAINIVPSSTPADAIAAQQQALAAPKTTGVPDLSTLINIFNPHGTTPAQYSQLQPSQQSSIAKLVQQGLSALGQSRSEAAYSAGSNQLLAAEAQLRGAVNLGLEAVQNQQGGTTVNIPGITQGAEQIFKLPSGDIVPLTPEAFTYYVMHGVKPVQIT